MLSFVFEREIAFHSLNKEASVVITRVICPLIDK